MENVLLSFESVSSRLSSVLLVVPGLLTTFAGLYVWLGGNLSKRLTLSLTLALLGCLLGSPFFGHIGSIIGAIGGLVFGVIFGQYIAGVACGLLLGSGLFFGFASQNMAMQESGNETSMVVLSAKDTLNWSTSVEVMRDHAKQWHEASLQACSSMQLHQWAFLLAASLACAAFLTFWLRLGVSLYFSLAGSLLLYVGMILLLLQKGATPITMIRQRLFFHGLVLVGVVIFGWLAQMLIACRHPRNRRRRPLRSDDMLAEDDDQSWRTC